MSGRVGDLSPEQEVKLKQFRAAVSEVLRPDHDDHFLLRWLRARKFDLIEAEKMFRKSLEWRKAWGVDNILEYEFPEVLRLYASGGFVGHNKEGGPVWIFTHGLMDLRGFVRAAKKSDLVKYAIYVLEKSEEDLREQSKKLGKNIEHVTIIHDMEYLTLTQYGCKPVVELLIAVLKMLEANYPERIERTYLINCPRFMPFAFSFLKPFLAEETVKKFEFYGTEGWREALLKKVDPSELPKYWGGTKVDPDGDPRCPSLVRKGVPVPHSYYMNADDYFANDKNAKSAIVPKRSSLPVEINIDQPGSTIHWEFMTENHDIAFALIRRGKDVSDHGKQKSEDEVIIGTHRVNANFVVESGMFRCDVPGKYILEFDNSFSWFNSKKIIYSIDVTSEVST